MTAPDAPVFHLISGVMAHQAMAPFSRGRNEALNHALIS
jgi:hypothetical protein